jgi:hypothetical protein
MPRSSHTVVAAKNYPTIESFQKRYSTALVGKDIIHTIFDKNHQTNYDIYNVIYRVRRKNGAL